MSSFRRKHGSKVAAFGRDEFCIPSRVWLARNTDFVFPELSNSGSRPAEPGVYPDEIIGLHCFELAEKLLSLTKFTVFLFLNKADSAFCNLYATMYSETLIKKIRLLNIQLFLIVSILLMAAFAHGDIYRYIDKNGVWHFSPVPTDPRYKLFIRSSPHKNESPSLERSANQEIRDAQNSLKKLGYDPGEVDGIFGKMTRNALENFQRDAGLEITGQLDEQTKLRLGLPLQAPVEGSQSTEVHQYELMVVDVDGNPIEGVKIDYKLKNGPKILKNNTYITKSDGKLSENLCATHKLEYSFSIIEYKASKTGFYSKNGAFLPTFRTLSRVFFGVFWPHKAKYNSKLSCWALHASLPFAPCGSAFSLNPWRVVPITVCLAAAH